MGNTIHLGGTARSPDDVRRLHALGLSFAEIPISDTGKFSNHIAAYQDLRKKLGIYYLCHGPREGDPNNPETLENTYLPKLMRILAIMSELGMRLLTVHLYLDARFVSPELIDYKIGFLRRVINRAKEMGITICLENLSETALHLAPVFKALPDLGLTLDLGHAQLLAEKNTAIGFLDRYPDRIKHVHIHDNRGGNSPSEDLHLPVGEGIVDFEAIFQKLNKIGYQKTITLELKPAEIEKNLSKVMQLFRSAGFLIINHQSNNPQPVSCSITC